MRIWHLGRSRLKTAARTIDILPSLTHFGGFLLLALVAIVFEPALASTQANDCQAIRSPDGSDFDWGAINSDEEIKDCLMRLAKNLQAPERMAEWLKRQGFSDVELYLNPDKRLFLNAIWDAEVSGARIPFADNLGFFERWTTSGKHYRVQVSYESRVPKSSTAHHTLK